MRKRRDEWRIRRRANQLPGAGSLSHPVLAAKVLVRAKRARPPKATDADALLLAALLVESSDDAIIGMTGQSVITTWNRSAQRLYGYSASEVIGRKGVTAVLPKEAGATQAAVSLITDVLVTKVKNA